MDLNLTDEASQSTAVWTDVNNHSTAAWIDIYNQSYTDSFAIANATATAKTTITTTIGTIAATEEDLSYAGLASLIAGVVMTILILLVILLAIIYEHCGKKNRDDILLTNGRRPRKYDLEGVDNPAVLEDDSEPQMKCHEKDPQPSTSRETSPAHTAAVMVAQPAPDPQRGATNGGAVSEIVDRQQIEKMQEGAENSEWEL